MTHLQARFFSTQEDPDLIANKKFEGFAKTANDQGEEDEIGDNEIQMGQITVLIRGHYDDEQSSAASLYTIFERTVADSGSEDLEFSWKISLMADQDEYMRMLEDNQINKTV